ncbi:MAG: NADH-quinone oxidoreductase subunit NuoE [Acidobacteria bacterium]|nr:NADH-quinone oxidoreductase subunit NuoE [Acidobacteriota bacterium]MBI3655177.1 NADH-quinone oxidoreductase subunit NuoE [Acidobacteriota bacterium]
MLSETTRAKILELIQKYPHKRTALIPVLYVVQAELGHISEPAMTAVGELFGLSPAEVKEVVTFYTMFYRAPVGKHVLQVCTNISCMLCRAEEILDYLKTKLGIAVGETTPDGKFTLLEVECMGACEAAPAMQDNYDYHFHMTKEKIDRLLEILR